jgi:hypothetical protein
VNIHITCLSHPWLREKSDPNLLKNFDSRPNHSFFRRGNPLSPDPFHEKRGRLFINKSSITGRYNIKTTLNYDYRNSRALKMGCFGT